MDIIFFIIFGIGIATFISVLLQHLGRISKHLRLIRLQLEIQNPLFTSEQLLELDKSINYWQEKMMKYRNKYDDKNKEIRDMTFKLFWAYVERLNYFRNMINEARENNNPDKINDKHRKWLDENEKEIDDMEEKAKVLDVKIKNDLDKKDLDLEFLGRWDKNEN